MLLRKKVLFVVLGLSLLLLAGCARQPQAVTGGNGPQAPGELTLATTTSTYDSGLLDYLLPFFEAKYNYKVRVVSLGTGAALELGKNGDCDIVLVHARDAELQMVKEGHYVDRRDVMYNDFIIVGPAAHPSGLKSISGLTDALLAVSETGSVFISRGDDSGTHKKELSLWQKAGIEPAGGRYIKAGSGMGDTLRMTDEKLGYTLTDRATYLSLRDKLDLVIVFEGGEDLFNQYGIMAVNPDRYPQVDYKGATLLIEFFVSAEGQELIAGFKPFGDTLFFPNAD